MPSQHNIHTHGSILYFITMILLYIMTITPPIISALPHLNLDIVPTSPHEHDGIYFIGEIICDDELGCSKSDQLHFSIPHVSLDSSDNNYIQSIVLTIYDESGVKISNDDVIIPFYLDHSKTILSGSTSLQILPNPIPKAQKFYLSGLLTIKDIPVELLNDLMTHNLKMTFGYTMGQDGQKDVMIDATIIWYTSGSLTNPSTIQFIPQPSTKSEQSRDNWDVLIEIPKVTRNPYFFDITFHGLFNFLSKPICSVNGNVAVSTYVYGNNHKPAQFVHVNGQFVDTNNLTTPLLITPHISSSTYNHIRISTTIKHLASYDSGIDMYVVCKNLDFSISSIVQESKFGFISVAVRENSTSTLIPIVSTFNFDLKDRLVDLDLLGARKIFTPYLSDAHISPIIPTENKAQLAYRTLLSLQYRFKPTDRRYILGYPHKNTNNQQDGEVYQGQQYISPAELFSIENLHNYQFELEVTWSTQERITVDSTWSLQQIIQYTLPKPDENSLISSGAVDINSDTMITNHGVVLKSGPILANRFHQQVSWISSPFYIDPDDPINESDGPFVNIEQYPEYVTAQEAVLRIQIQVFHDDIPSFDDEQTPTIVLHTKYLGTNPKHLTNNNNDNGNNSNNNGNNSNDDNMKEIQTNVSKKIKATQSSLLNSQDDKNDPKIGTTQDDIKYLEQSIPMSHLRRVHWPLKIIPTLSTIDNQTWLTNLAMIPVIDPKAPKRGSNEIVGFGFEVTFTTSLPLLYSEYGFEPNIIILDLTSVPSYRFNVPGNDNRSVATTPTPTTLTPTTDLSNPHGANPTISCYWNGHLIDWGHVLDTETTPITIQTSAFNTKYPLFSEQDNSLSEKKVKLRYRSLTVILPDEMSISSAQTQYTLKCDGPMIVPTSNNLGPYLTDQDRLFLRMRTYYDSGSTSTKSNPMSNYQHQSHTLLHPSPSRSFESIFWSRLEFAVDIPFNFGEKEIDKQQNRTMLLIIIALPASFAIAGVLVWKRYKGNQKNQQNYHNLDGINHHAVNTTSLGNTSIGSTLTNSYTHNNRNPHNTQSSLNQDTTRSPHTNTHVDDAMLSTSSNGYQQLV